MNASSPLAPPRRTATPTVEAGNRRPRPARNKRASSAMNDNVVVQLGILVMLAFIAVLTAAGLLQDAEQSAPVIPAACSIVADTVVCPLDEQR